MANGILNLRYYANRNGSTAPASYYGRPGLHPETYFYIGSFGPNQKRPFINSKNQICRILYGKTVVLEKKTIEYQNWLAK